MLTVTATQATREFSKLMREVGNGNTVLILSHGKPFANITPVEDKTEREKAREELFAHLAKVECIGERDWTRDEIYGDRLRCEWR
jgi:prevent-host-death family protein